MPVLKIAAAAEEDLKEIWSYVAEYNEEAAGKIIREITGRFSVLRDRPQLGRKQDELLVNLRSFVVKNFLIFYQPVEDGIEVLRVLHASRDIESIFESFFDSL
ncbi:MAG TPA: type II toxin-antitoxin system RelE/ParE family toxin [Pyrinomonadaceae bacterium]|jgi:toxin ParE1/3/4